MKGALLVGGTHSDAGKSVVTAGICRWLHRTRVRVAPFKAQNMALNSAVTLDGSEIGRAQAVQAAAAGIELDARSYQELKDELRPIVAAALADLRERYDVVVCEGAGSPAETNLRAADLATVGRAALATEPGVRVRFTRSAADVERADLLVLPGTKGPVDDLDRLRAAGLDGAIDRPVVRAEVVPCFAS